MQSYFANSTVGCRDRHLDHLHACVRTRGAFLGFGYLVDDQQVDVDTALR